jgi:hypothetical protein
VLDALPVPLAPVPSRSSPSRAGRGPGAGRLTAGQAACVRAGAVRAQRGAARLRAMMGRAHDDWREHRARRTAWDRRPKTPAGRPALHGGHGEGNTEGRVAAAMWMRTMARGVVMEGQVEGVEGGPW